jgi:hypothetical protein
MANKRLQIITICIIFSIMMLGSCYYDSTLPIADEEITGEVSFSTDIIAIFNKDCNTSGCHNTGGIKPDLSPTQAYLSLTNGNYVNSDNPEESSLYQWMKGNRASPMPLSGPDASHNAKVLAWIKQGVQNN